MVLSTEPFVAVDHSALCESQIERMLAIEEYVASNGWDFATGQTTRTDSRTSSTYFDMLDQFADIRSHVLQRLSDLWGHQYQIAAAESLQLTKYIKDQHYVPHWDYFNVPGVAASTDNDRVATVIIYLNDSFLGGTTSFPRLDLKVTAKAGHMLYFHYPPGAQAELSMHSGDHVLDGEKRIATMWIRQR